MGSAKKLVDTGGGATGIRRAGGSVEPSSSWPRPKPRHHRKPSESPSMLLREVEADDFPDAAADVHPVIEAPP